MHKQAKLCIYDLHFFSKALHLKAVGETLEIIDATLPLKLANTQKSAYAWLQSVYSCQRAVNSALHLPVGTSQSKELVSKLRYTACSSITFGCEFIKACAAL